MSRSPRNRTAPSGSYRTLTGKGRSSRPGKNIWRSACPISSRRCGSCESSRAIDSRSTRSPTCGRSWSDIPPKRLIFAAFSRKDGCNSSVRLDVMPDDNMPGGETFIRQMQYGKGYYREKLGVDVTAGWLIDTFGHHAQLPQLLTKGGFKTFWFVRGVPRRISPPSSSGRGSTGPGSRRSICRTATPSCIGSPNDTAKFKAFASRGSTCCRPNSHGPRPRRSLGA